MILFHTPQCKKIMCFSYEKRAYSTTQCEESVVYSGIYYKTIAKYNVFI